MALLNQSFLLRGPLPDSTTYRSRYLLSAGNASMVRSACFVEPASSCLLLVCMQLFFFSPLSPPPAPSSRLLVAITDGLDPPTLSLCPSASRLLHMPACALTTWQW